MNRRDRFFTIPLALMAAMLIPACSSDNSHNASDEGIPQGFVLISDVIPDVIQEIRYHSTYNFTGARIDGYEAPVAIITREAAEALKKVNDEMKAKGYRLKIYDAYRPQCAVDHFVRWAENIGDTITKRYFYPDIRKDELFEKEFISTKSGHTRGSTVDLTLFDMQSGKEVDMGGSFDWFGELSHPDCPTITAEQSANRLMLREVMLKYGFRGISMEWWHFTLKNEPYPDTYFNFPVKVY